jgi:hypothetical protein
MEFGFDGAGSIFCEVCGAADADEDLKLCPNCLGEVRDESENGNSNSDSDTKEDENWN